jgi:hypothetical protein
MGGSRRNVRTRGRSGSVWALAAQLTQRVPAERSLLSNPTY